MTEHLNEEVVEGGGEDVNLAPSIRDALVARRESVSRNRFYDLDIPGYDGKLFCRYNLLDSKRLNSIGERISRTIRDTSDRNVAAAMDTLIAACDQFYVRYDGRETPLSEVIGQDTPVRYDQQLAEFLKFLDELPDPPTARAVCSTLFLGNEIAIAHHSATLSRWMMGNEGGIDEELFEDPL